MSEQEILSKINEILAILQRMEVRQQTIKAEIEEQPVVGSFASTDNASADKGVSE